MPATSPFQGNDYQAVSQYRPYSLRVNDIFKANSALDAYWDDGARSVKKAYENVVDLKLHTTENRQIRDQFVQDAQKQITKISSMNLADPSVQRQGIDIFKPLYKDQNIVGEDYVIRNGEQELATGETFRTKDGGKNYNPLSIENIKFEQNLLSIDPAKGGLNKRDGWKAIVNNQSTYTPYTDISKEYKQIQDAVKAEEIKNASISGDQWYIEEVSKKGVSKDRMQAAIEEMGSPQLKEQMRVEGRNIYYKKLSADPTQVDGYFQSLAGSYYDTKINELKNRKAEIEYNNYMTPDKPEYAAKKQSYKNTSEELDKTITSLETKYKPDYIREFNGLSNLDNLSSNISKIEQLWQQSSIDNLSGKLAYETSSREIKANPAKIAKENLNLGMQRLQENYIDLLKNINKSTGSAGGGNSNFLLPGGNGTANVPVNYNTPSQKDLDTFRKVADTMQKEFDNNDEPIREAAVTNIVGNQAWNSIQDPANVGKKTSDVLVDTEIQKAAEFLKAYSDKHTAEELQVGRIPILNKPILVPKGLSIDQYKEYLGNLSAAGFKNIVGKLVKSDVDLTIDLIGKLATENGVDKAANFRNTYNNTLRNQMNLSANITNQVAEKLGDYASLFRNNGKVNLTDSEIADAYNKGIQSNKLIAHYNVVITHPSSNPNTTEEKYIPLTEKEFNDYKSGKVKNYDGYVVSRVPSLSEFSSTIRRKTDPVYYRLKMENNQAGNQYTYNDKNNEEKIAALNRFETISPDVQGTDATPDNKEIFSFLKSNAKHLIAQEIKTPGPDETLPSVKFTMENFGTGKEQEELKKMVDKVNSTWFRTTDVPADYFSKGNSSGSVRYRGAYVSYIPSKMPNGQEAGIFIRNLSTSPATIEPDIQVKNLYVLRDINKGPVEENKLYITKDLVKKQFQDSHNNTPIEVYMQNDVDEVNRFLSALVTNIEQKNKVKEK